MANEEKLLQLARSLLERTGENKIEWTSSGNDVFQASFPSGAVSVTAREMHVYDANGTYLETLTGRTTEALRILGSLYTAARNAALNIDTALDGLLGDIEKAERPP